MKVADLMTRKVLYCHEDASANTAAHLMWETDCGSIPVVGEGLKLTGIVTDRDICMAAYTQGLPLTSIRVSSAMAHKPTSVHPSDDVAVAHQKMRDHQIRRLPVVDTDGALCGILSLCDLARAAKGREGLEADVGKTLAAISKASPGSSVGTKPGAEAVVESETISEVAGNAGGVQAEAGETPSGERPEENLAAPRMTHPAGAVAAEPLPAGNIGTVTPPTSPKPEGSGPRPAPRKRTPRKR
jgi:CBS domain-containing protein